MVSFKSLEVSLEVEDLEIYVTTGEITREFSAYARLIPPQDLEDLRGMLQRPVALNPAAVARLSYTPMGEIVLKRLGSVLQTGARQNGFLSLRSSFLTSATDPEGITLLNVIKNFPTPAIRIDLDTAVEVVEEAISLYYQREALVEGVQEISRRAQIAQPDPVDFSQWPDLREPGPWLWSRQSLNLFDQARNRPVPTDIYWPNHLDRAPIVVISHGVGGDRFSLAYVAEHLASYGFVVVVPEHVGSNAQTVQDFFKGLTEPLPQEAVDRPWDITFVLNVLEYFSRASDRWASRLDFSQVGVLGQSFGAYTSLALGGATLNFQALADECDRPEVDNTSLNVSLLIQCTAYLLPHQPYPLRDPRVKAVFAINPFTSHVFGPEGLSQLATPALIMAGEDDFVVPAGPEQIYPFTWIQGNDRYLAVLEHGTHFSTLATEETGQGVFPIPAGLLGPDPRIAHRYTNSLALAFFQTYLGNQANPPERIYLQPSYATFLSEDPMPLTLVNSLPPEVLQQVLAEQKDDRL